MVHLPSPPQPPPPRPRHRNSVLIGPVFPLSSTSAACTIYVPGSPLHISQHSFEALQQSAKKKVQLLEGQRETANSTPELRSAMISFEEVR